MTRKACLFGILALLCLGYALPQWAVAAPFDSPLTGPSPLFVPTPEPTPVLSAEVEAAMRYFVTAEGVPREHLVYAGEETLDFPLLGRSFINVMAFSDLVEDPRSFSVLIDSATLTAEPNFNSLRAAEDAAYQAKYGKLDPLIYDRLQNASDDTVLPVAIWVAGSSAVRTQESIEAEIIARYPEAKEALAHKGTLWAVEDPQRAIAIQVAYEQIIATEVAIRVHPLKRWLEEQGFTVREIAGMPSLAVDLPKWAIIAVTERTDVAQVYDISQKAVPAIELTPIEQASYEWGVNLREFLW